MFDLRPLAFIVGCLLAAFGVAMLLPAMFDLANGHKDWQGFLFSALITLFAGASLAFVGRGPSGEAPSALNLRQAFLLTTLSGIALALFGAIPFTLVSADLDFTDAFFESLSGLTTTGATVMTGLDQSPSGILVWRGLLQWIGGIGIVVAATAIMPTLRVGGMQLFRIESSNQSEKFLPRVGQIAGARGLVYLLLSLACGMSLWLAGMSPFDAMVHSMTTVSAGGFSTSDMSFAHWNNVWIEAAAIPFMLIAAMPFTLLWVAMNGNVRGLWRDSQVQTFLALTAVAVLVMTVYQWLNEINGGWMAFRYAAFNISSMTSGSGFVSTDYSAWGPFAMVLILFLMLISGCTGSTASGLKIFRLQLLYISSLFQIKRTVHAGGVFKAHYNNRPLPAAAASAVTGFFFLYIMTFVVIGMLLMGAGLDFVTAISSAAAALANVGPGLGPIIGGQANYASLPDGVIWILSAAMLLGRLELLPVFVLLMPRFWRG